MSESLGAKMVDVWSEDIAEIRNAVWVAYPHVPKRRDELTEILNLIYNGLFMDCKPVILFDRSKPELKSCKTKEANSQ